MLLITPNLALGIFVLIIIISIIIALWMGTYSSYDKCSFHTFISILAGLGVFVTFIFYYNVVQLQNQQQQLVVLQDLTRINDSSINGILEEMKDASTIIPNFVLSITPLNNTVCCFTSSGGGTGPATDELESVCNIIGSSPPSDPINPQTCTEKMILSNRIFSLWQDTVIAHIFSYLDPTSYITTFLQRANSSQLYVQWTVSKLDYNVDTQSFGDLLFEYALPITNQTPEEYITVASKLINDPRYKNIF